MKKKKRRNSKSRSSFFNHILFSVFFRCDNLLPVLRKWTVGTEGPFLRHMFKVRRPLQQFLLLYSAHPTHSQLPFMCSDSTRCVTRQGFVPPHMKDALVPLLHTCDNLSTRCEWFLQASYQDNNLQTPTIRPRSDESSANTACQQSVNIICGFKRVNTYLIDIKR